MPTSIIMLIYEIMNNKYRVESKTLCCGHDWLRVFVFLGTDHNASCSSRYSALFPRDKSLGVEVLTKVPPPKKSPLSCRLFLFIWESETFCLPFLIVMMTLLVIMTFSFFHIFLLSCCLVSKMGYLMSDFKLIGGIFVAEMYVLIVVIRAELAIHPSWSSHMSSIHPYIWLRPLTYLAIGRLYKCVGCRLLALPYLGGPLFGLPGLSNFHYL